MFIIVNFSKQAWYAVVGLGTIFSIAASVADVLEEGTQVHEVILHLIPVLVQKLRITVQKAANLLSLAT